MNDNTDKYLDNLSKKVIKSANIETPSFNFTDAVMSQVDTVNKSSTTYKPLISRMGWTVVFAVLLGIILCFVLGVETQTSSVLYELDFSVLSNNRITEAFTNFTLPKTLGYAIVFLGLMFCIQIPLLKHYFDNRI